MPEQTLSPRDELVVETIRQCCELAARRWHADPQEAYGAVWLSAYRRLTSSPQASATLREHLQGRAREYFWKEYGSRSGRPKRIKSSINITVERSTDNSFNPIQILQRKEAIEACSALPDDFRACLFAVFNIAGSPKEAASELKCSLSTVYGKAQRALALVSLRMAI